MARVVNLLKSDNPCFFDLDTELCFTELSTISSLPQVLQSTLVDNT